MKIALGSDHRGYKIKEEIKNFLLNSGYEVKDFGCFSEESCDYPDYARPVAEGVAQGNFDCSILFCATGIGMSIAANKIPGIRAALCLNKKMARFSREHNNANVLCLSADVLSLKRIRGIVEVWLKTEFTGGRHERRINKILEIENKYLKR
jgi:ribose 5-phosphate isomerase B